MTVELDQVIFVGDIRVAALAQGSAKGAAGAGFSFHGTKHPVAIIVRRDNQTMAFDCAGTRIELDDLDQRFPGCRAEFERLAAGDRQHHRWQGTSGAQ